MGTGSFSPVIPSCEILIGDVRAQLRELIRRKIKVRTVVTSPPYWGLRCYDTVPQIWGGKRKCEHDFAPAPSMNRGGPQGKTGGRADRDTFAQDSVGDISTGEFCRHCGAWRGELGLEPTPMLWVKHIVEVFDLVWQVLADDGTVWVNFGDSYAQGGRGTATGSTLQGGQRNQVRSRRDASRSQFKALGEKQLIGQPWRAAFALQEAGWILRQDIIWAKPSPMPESCRDRCTKSHEYVFLLSKQEKYFFDQEAIKEPCTGGAHSRGSGVNPKANGTGGFAQWQQGRGAHNTINHNRALPRSKQNASFSGVVNQIVETRNKRSVWWIPSEPFLGAHYATFPTGLVRPCILAGSRPGETVLDIFGGSGTVGEVSLEYGRSCILIDLDPRNEALMLERCNHTPGLGI